MDRPTCKTCFYWAGYNKDITGVCNCQKETPKVTFLGAPSALDSVWPSTDPDQWCGEHPNFHNWTLCETVEGYKPLEEAEIIADLVADILERRRIMKEDSNDQL